MTYETKTLRQQYRVRAHSIGSNAITLVNEFFDLFGGIEDRVEYPLGGDWVKCKYYQWTLTDLDMALDEMSGKQNKPDEVEVKIVDNRDKYTKALARCAFHDPDKYALLTKRMESCDDETIGKLILRKIEVNEVLLDHHAEFFLEGLI